MDLTPTDEQHALREAVRGFLARIQPAEAIGPALNAAPAWPQEAWPQLAAQGLIGISISDESGGAGLGLVEEAIVAEEAAAALLPVPLHSVTALALGVLVRADAARDLLEQVVGGTRIVTLAWADAGDSHALREMRETAATALPADDGGWQISGRKQWVPDATRAHSVIVPARARDGLALYVIDTHAPGVHITARETLDAVRPLADLELSGAPARLLIGPEASAEVMASVRIRALTLAAAAAVGIAQRVLQITLAYVSSREQFGRPIGTYQAVSHRVADMYVHLELSRSLVLWAAVTADDPQTTSAARTAVAEAAASKALPAAVAACETAIQLHGGIGVTWENTLHWYYKHAIALCSLADDAPQLRRLAMRDGARALAPSIGPAKATP